MLERPNPAAGGAPVMRNVQALRAVAAILVVLIHATLPNVGVESALAVSEAPWLTPFRFIGPSGVDLFFVISGFIMLVTNWESFGGRGAGLVFLARRAIRIYPPYWFALLPALAVLFFAPQLMVSRLGAKTGVLNSILLLPNADRFVLTVAWTLVWEMLFYVVFALILTLDRRFAVRAFALWAAAQVALYLGLSNATSFYLGFFSAPIPLEFIAGAAVGYLYVKRLLPRPRLVAALAFVATSAAWLFVALNRLELSPGDIQRVLVFGPAAVLTVYAAVSLEINGAFRTPLALAAVGDGSYAIYLWHLSVLVAIRQLVARYHPAGPIAHAVVIVGTIAVIVVAGLIVYRVFEKPGTAYLNRLLLQRAELASRPAVALGPRTLTERSILVSTHIDGGA